MLAARLWCHAGQKGAPLLAPRLLYLATLALSLLALLPLALPLMYLDGNPVTVPGPASPGPVRVYMGDMERLRLAYLPLLMASVGLLVLSVAGLASPGMVSHEYVLLLTVAYTFATIPVMGALQVPPSRLSETIAGMLVVLSFKEVEPTWLYHLLKYPVLFLAGLALSASLGLHVSLSSRREAQH